jgi:hypothetical protein
MEPSRDWDFSGNDIGYRLCNILVGHVTSIIVLVDSKDAEVLSELSMQSLKISWVFGYHDQPVYARRQNADYPGRHVGQGRWLPVPGPDDLPAW